MGDGGEVFVHDKEGETKGEGIGSGDAISAVSPLLFQESWAERGGGEVDGGVEKRDASVGGNSLSRKDVAPERRQLSMTQRTYSEQTCSHANKEVNPTLTIDLQIRINSL